MPIYKSGDYELLKEWEKIARSCGWWWPYENWLFISDRPKNIFWDNSENPRLHADGKPALEYRDGWKVYCLNGVRMDEWMVMTPAEQIDSEKILRVNNTEQRRELLRKVGVERFIAGTQHKILDTEGDYSLIEFEFNSRKMVYLKMRNPSVGVWHVEGVPRECRTVQHALIARRPKALRELPESENGEDWYQQGDVCIWPEGAKSIKPKPSVLT